MPDGERAPDISPLHRVSLRRNEASLVLLFVHKSHVQIQTLFLFVFMSD